MDSLSDILFHAEDVLLPGPLKSLETETKTWIYKLLQQEDKRLHTLNFIFCSDAYLLRINTQYLAHDDYTDIITFDNSEDDDEIEGDIFISLERVAENAASFQVPLEEELRRVMAHGVLHLCGYNDKSEPEVAAMRQKEAEALDLSAKYIL